MPGAAIRELVRESLKDNLCVREAEPSTLKESPLKFLNFEKHLKNLCETLGLLDSLCCHECVTDLLSVPSISSHQKSMMSLGWQSLSIYVSLQTPNHLHV